MADYFSTQGMDLPDNSSEGLLFKAPSPWQYGKQLENQKLAQQYYQQAIQDQQRAAERSQYDFDKTKATDARMNAVYNDPRYAALFTDSELSKLRGGIGENTAKYINTVLSNEDQLLAPRLAAAKTPEQKQAIINEYVTTSQGLGMNVPGMGITPEAVLARNDRFRNDQEYKSKLGIQDDQQDYDWKALMAKLESDWKIANLQAATSRARSGGSGGGLPKGLDAAWIQSFVRENGRLPNTQDIAGYLGQKPQYNPIAQEQISGGRTIGKGQADLQNLLNLIGTFQSKGVPQITQPRAPVAPAPQQAKPKVIKLD